MSAMDAIGKEDVLRIVRDQDRWRGTECLNMIASENVMSPLATKAYVSDFMHRYAEGSPFKRFYQGARNIDELESSAIELAKQVFGATKADLRPISGGVANAAAFSGLTSHGDLLLSPGVAGGSHISHEPFGVAGVLGLRVEHAAFDEQEYNIDVDESISKIRRLKPNLVTLGGSVILFPHPVREFSSACAEVGAKLLYDGAHVLGLIAGKQFQDPFREGADIMTASTHKTFPGPQGGIILGNTEDEAWKKVKFRIFPGLVSNHHLHRIPAMLIALLEAQRFGADYARQTVKNARALGEALEELGFKVLASDKGYTKSHQILVDVRENGGGKYVAGALEEANIILNKNILAWDDVNNPDDPSGLRIGTQELTRMGMKESEMKHVAELMRRVVMDKADRVAVREEVIGFRRDFQQVHYCFGE
ncbi:MAG: serine hydroxymethyltransferase [Candidatus Aenigmarchaeota archaeon]|nr:serine hydroxymethyltransferase [Candidatus Aenigmarchaeota archaeon]